MVLGGVLRAVYLLRMDLPIYDPWRHLLLIRNIREGHGFTLFEGQPYVWYQPGWHQLCAALPIGADWLAGLFSWLSVALFYFVLLPDDRSKAAGTTATVGALIMAAFGPLITFTCHYGSEAFALLLLLAGLLVAARTKGAAAVLGAGVLVGIALTARMNMVFGVFLVLPWLRRRNRAVAFVAGTALPLVAVWWRNRQAIQRHPFLFSWDGLATESAGYGPLSTLMVQWHPAVQEGLRRLHEVIVPTPEWIRDSSGPRWDLMLFMLTAVVCLAACRRLHVLAAGVAGLVYFLLLDRSLSSNFFRIYLGIFPLLFAAVASVAARLRNGPGRQREWAAVAVVILVLLTGVRGLDPPPAHPLEEVTPPADLLTLDAYMVAGGFYQPESLIYRYPETRFIGLPLAPDAFDEFARHYPEVRGVVRHDFSVQAGLEATLRKAGYRSRRVAFNAYGRRYEVLERAEEQR